MTGRKNKAWDMQEKMPSTRRLAMINSTAEESAELEIRARHAAAAVEGILAHGLENAMNQFNVRSPKGDEHPPSETLKTLD